MRSFVDRNVVMRRIPLFNFIIIHLTKTYNNFTTVSQYTTKFYNCILYEFYRVKNAMNERNLNEGQWEERSNGV